MAFYVLVCKRVRCNSSVFSFFFGGGEDEAETWRGEKQAGMGMVRVGMGGMGRMVKRGVGGGMCDY